MPYIVYKGNCYTNLKIYFPSLLNGSDFYRFLELFEFPLKKDEEVLFKFALTELVNNSIRALREKNKNKEITIDFKISENFIKFVLTDFGGGFDLTKLPFDINDEKLNLNILSEEFQEYRERHGYNRFGIGICSARMALDAFHLVFIDENGKETKWENEGSVAGTKITAAKRISALKEDLIQGAFIRKEKRFSFFSRIMVNENIEGYLIDLSLHGIRLLIINRLSFQTGEKIAIKFGNGEGISFKACVRWVNKEGVFWQIGGELLCNGNEELAKVEELFEKLKGNPTAFKEVVVVEGN